jgi:hypothetical protein
LRRRYVSDVEATGVSNYDASACYRIAAIEFDGFGSEMSNMLRKGLGYAYGHLEYLGLWSVSCKSGGLPSSACTEAVGLICSCHEPQRADVSHQTASSRCHRRNRIHVLELGT